MYLNVRYVTSQRDVVVFNEVIAEFHWARKTHHADAVRRDGQKIIGPMERGCPIAATAWNTNAREAQGESANT